MDEQMIAEMTNAVWDKLETIDTAPGVGDTMLTYAELKAAMPAAHSVMAGKVAELIEALREARPYLEPARLREEADAKERLIDRCPVRQLCKRIDAALAPYPERRSE